MELVPLINSLYINAWEPFHNFFRPNMKLISKTRIGSRYQKKYDEPKTPYQRLLNSGCLTKDQTEKLQKIKTTLNPITLKKEIEKKLKKVVWPAAPNGKRRRRSTPPFAPLRRAYQGPFSRSEASEKQKLYCSLN